MGDSVLRIEGYMPGYQGGGAGGVFVMPRHNRAQRFHVLFASIEAADMEAAQHAITALLNFDPKLAQDVDFAKISRAVQEKHAYAAQHFAHEYQAKLAHQLQTLSANPSFHETAMRPHAGVRSGEDGLPHIDTLA